MSDTPTPGEICYAAYQAQLPERAYFPAASWLVIDAAHQRAWEAAAAAVLAHGTPSEDPPRRWTPQPLHATGDDTPQEDTP